VPLPGFPLGAFDLSSYEETVLDLRPGDVLVFHTDGVTEASREGEEYGVERLIRQVEEHAHRGAAGLGGQIVADLDAFLGPVPPADDVTVVVVRAR
jgi:sigma-B regulation protein RsbU (phosphoserine phosphatase)